MPNSPNRTRLNKVTVLLRVEKFFKEDLWIHLLVLTFMTGCAWLFDKPWEAVMFFVSHTVIRQYFDKQYHCRTLALCLILTLSVMFFGIVVTLPVEIGLLSAIPVGCFISWIGYLVQSRIDLLNYRRKREAFNLETCTEEEIVEKCKLLHYNANKIKVAVMLFVEKKSIMDVFHYLDAHEQTVEIDSVYQIKKRIKRDLKKFIDN